jgi:hypothetical protein
MKATDDFFLTRTVTVGQLKAWMVSNDDQAKKKIIELIRHRFTNRYLIHLHNIDSGFLKMGIACLTIETLESFKQGEKDTKKKGVGLKMFQDFFHTEAALFPGFRSIANDFYSNVRCGILHQAETTNGWRILLGGPLLDKPGKAINSRSFVIALDKAVDRYEAELRSNDLDSQLWKFAFKKLQNICANCKIRY